MEERKISSENDSIIPQTIHAVWLGGLPGSDIIVNLGDWAKINKSYQISLWVDSSTYTSAQQAEYQQLIKSAKENHIEICDVALEKKAGNEIGVQGRNEIYQNMMSKTYYDDEIGGQYRNLAAASDILRAEILNKEGGSYIDARDIFTGQPLPERMTAPYGFLCHHYDDENRINNDILASVPNGTFITAFQKKIHDNYQKLYQNTQQLNAHRNPELTSPSLWSGANPRKLTTLQTSGPGALDAVLMEHLDKREPIPEADGKIFDYKSEHLVYFDNKYVSLPTHGQDLSWFQTKVEYKEVTPIMRNYVREYFNNMIDERQVQIHNLLQKEQKKGVLFRDNNKIKELKNVAESLQHLKGAINAYSPSISMEEVNGMCKETLGEKNVKLLNKHCDNIMVRLDNCSKSSESMIKHCQINYQAKDVAEVIEYMSSKYNKPNWHTFMQDVVDTKSDKPNLAVMQNYIEVSSKQISEFRSSLSSQTEKPAKLEEPTTARIENSTATMIDTFLKQGSNSRLEDLQKKEQSSPNPSIVEATRSSKEERKKADLSKATAKEVPENQSKKVRKEEVRNSPSFRK